MMKKIIIFLLVFICIFLISCNKEYTIEFETNGGNKIQKIEIKDIDSFKNLETPTKEGYVFCGWYLDENFTEEFKTLDNLDKNIKLYARWEKEVHVHEFIEGICVCGEIATYTVVFNDSKLENIKVKYGEKIEEPKEINKEGCIFLGWFIDPEYKTLYDFDTTIKSDLNLYGKWHENIIKGNENKAIINEEYVDAHAKNNELTIDNNIKEIYGSSLTNINKLNFIGTIEEFRSLKIYGDINSEVYINGDPLTFEIINSKNGFETSSSYNVNIKVFLDDYQLSDEGYQLPKGSKLTQTLIKELFTTSDVFTNWNGLGTCILKLYEDENKTQELDINYFKNINCDKTVYVFFEETNGFINDIQGEYKTANGEVCVVNGDKITLFGKEYSLESNTNGNRIIDYGYSDSEVYISFKIYDYYMNKSIIITMLDEITSERFDGIFYFVV